MDHYSILRNAEENRTRVHDDVARHRRAARARAAQPGTNRRGPGYRLGGALVVLGNRLQGITPTRLDTAPLPDPAASVSTSQ